MNTTTDHLWQASLNRDTRYDGQFVMAVRTTHIYCKPSCAARMPKRENVEFFNTPEQAEIAGYRACKRCHPDKLSAPEANLELIQHVIRTLEERVDDTPTLAELAAQFHLSPYHLQRTFKRIVGVTPKQYALGLRVQRFKQGLKDGQRVTEAALDSGFNGNAHMYVQASAQMGMTPKMYQRGAPAIEIAYAIVASPLGHLLVAATEKGVCSVKLGDNKRALEAELRHEFASATIVAEHSQLRAWADAIVEYLRGAQPHLDLPTDVRATAFQRRVWDALRDIPLGATRSYTEVAKAIGQPTAARAVARACATNPTALVVPCHRVVGEDGKLHGYRWGAERKRKLLAQEKRLAESTD
ncbi:MAG: bifunctional DNA-binding transcriptional regulator/O6-methylguanine-DNA methyltransferase Ada [Anaerolineales bacterium]